MTPYLNTKELRRKFCQWYPKQYSVPFDMLTTEAQDMVIREFLTFTYQQVVVDLPVKDIYL